MKKIRVHTAFSFTNPDYSQTNFSVGDHSVKDSIAEHWFTLEHAEILGGGKEEQAEVDALFQSEITNLQEQLIAEQGKVVELEKMVSDRDQVIAGHVQTISDSETSITNLREQLKNAKNQLATYNEGLRSVKK